MTRVRQSCSHSSSDAADDYNLDLCSSKRSTRHEAQETPFVLLPSYPTSSRTPSIYQNMSNFIDDVLGPPRKRSKTPGRSPLGTPSSLRREQSADVFHSALTVPTQASLALKSKAERSSAGEASKTSGAAPAQGDTPHVEPSPSRTPLPPDLPPPQEEGENKPEGQAQAELIGEPAEVPTVDKSVQESEGGNPSTLNILPPLPVIHNLPAVLIGISGCTGSGKTALSHLLASVLPQATAPIILHLEDFFIPKHFLIPSKDGDRDADCQDAINFKALIRVLRFFKHEGKMPPGFHTDQDETYEQEHASTLVSENVINEIKGIVAGSAYLEDGPPICIVDGFLLYHEPRIRELLDIKLFLRTTKEIARTRRFEKPEYAGEHAEEEFWRTQSYFDRKVWPHHIEEHGPLFEKGDVEETPLFKLCDYLRIEMQPRLEMSIEDILRWAASCIANKTLFSDVGRSRSLDPKDVLGDRFEICDCGSGWVGKLRRFLVDII